MTMTSSAFHEVGWVCPEVADETNPRVKPSPISWTHVNWGGLLVDCGSGASRVFFLRHQFCCLRLHRLRYE